LWQDEDVCLCVVCQRPVAGARVETWRPGAAGVESVRQQARYDHSRTEEHPGAADSDDDEPDDEADSKLHDGRYEPFLALVRQRIGQRLFTLWHIASLYCPHVTSG